MELQTDERWRVIADRISKSNWTGPLLGTALFALNLFLSYRLLLVEFTTFMGSIEAAYIGIARYHLEHPFEFGWFSDWYLGVPFQNTYPPLLHMIVAGVSALFRLSPGHSYHVVSALFYAAGPVAFYLLLVELSGRRAVSFWSAVGFSLFSPAAFISHTVRDWSGSLGNPARLHSLVMYGDTPHVAALTLLPLALLALHRALVEPSCWRWLLASIGLAAVVLTNWLGAFALALAVICYAWAATSKERRLKSMVLIGLVAYAIAAPWVPPSTIRDIQHNAQFVIGNYALTKVHAAVAVALVAAAFLMRTVLVRMGFPFVHRFWALNLLLITGVFMSEELGLSLVPQSLRYHIEFEMAFWAIFIPALFAVARRWKLLSIGMLGLAVLLSLWQARRISIYARGLIKPIDITKTTEYRVGSWLGSNHPGERTFVSGSTQFWLSAFADVPQVGGGFGQGIVNRSVPMVHYGVPYLTEHGRLLGDWLEVYGVDSVVVAGPKSTDSYREAWRDPAKFDGVLKILWRDGDDVIYAVDRAKPGLAHVIDRGSVVPIPPVNLLDTEPIQKLLKDLRDSTLPSTQFEWRGSYKAIVTTTITSPEQRLLVQASFHPGWKATSNGKEVEVQRDGLDFMIINPSCTGACAVELTFGNDIESTLARWASITAWAGLVSLSLYQFYSRMRKRPIVS